MIPGKGSDKVRARSSSGGRVVLDVAPIDMARLESSTIHEVAARHSFNPQRVWADIRAGRLRAVRPGGKGDYRILRVDEERWVNGKSPKADSA